MTLSASASDIRVDGFTVKTLDSDRQTERFQFILASSLKESAVTFGHPFAGGEESLCIAVLVGASRVYAPLSHDPWSV